ncbi:MAG: tetratricopeptide repeat protein, partial [Anaerolineae bacterium]
MNQRTITCPYCASQVSGESTICPGCQEDLAALAHLEYADAIHYNQALLFAKEGRLREAKAELEESLLANNTFGPSLALLAKVHAREGDWEKARVAVKKALSAMPADEATVKLADDIINAAPAVEPRRSSDVAQPVEVPAQPVTTPEVTEDFQQEADEPGPPAIEPLELPIIAPEAPKIPLSSKSKLITEHASAEDVASLTKPLPWQAQPEAPATRVVHVSRFDPIVP